MEAKVLMQWRIKINLLRAINIGVSLEPPSKIKTIIILFYPNRTVNKINRNPLIPKQMLPKNSLIKTA
jgi:hypothetical protein